MASIAGQAAMASLLSGGSGGGATPPSLTSTATATAKSNSSLSGGSITLGDFNAGSNNWMTLGIIGAMIIIGLVIVKKKA